MKTRSVWEEKFREARDEIGTTHLAYKVAVHPNTIYRWDSGTTVPNKNTQRRTLPVFQQILGEKPSTE